MLNKRYYLGRLNKKYLVEKNFNLTAILDTEMAYSIPDFI